MVVIAIIAILAALLLPALGQARARAHSIKCRSNLHQVGLALQMHVHDNDNCYPLGHDPYWFQRLAIYLPVAGTNSGLRCPGLRLAIDPWRSEPPFDGTPGPGYGYNWLGTDGPPYYEAPSALGLGLDGRPEAAVRMPGEMYAVTDSIQRGVGPEAVAIPWTYPIISRGIKKRSPRATYEIPKPPQHGSFFNVLFCDGHVSLTKTSELFEVEKTAANWNADHEPHPETW